jgi:GDPmannose 4,6-dehydratase
MLCGDATKIKTELGWKPETSLEDLIAMMVDADLRRVKQERS